MKLTISEDRLMHVNAHFLKGATNVWMKEDTISNISVIKYLIIFFFEILLNCKSLCSDLPGGTLTISSCHRRPLCSRQHLSERHCTWPLLNKKNKQVGYALTCL